MLTLQPCSVWGLCQDAFSWFIYCYCYSNRHFLIASNLYATHKLWTIVVTVKQPEVEVTDTWQAGTMLHMAGGYYGVKMILQFPDICLNQN